MKRVLNKKIILVISAIAIFFVVNKLYLYDKNRSVEVVTSFNSSNQESGIMLINKDNTLEKDYVPENLVMADIPFVEDIQYEEKFLIKEVAQSLVNMFNGANEEGIILRGVSGYRSYKLQDKLYKESLRTNGKEYTNSYVAKVGGSEHQTGLAMDIAGAVGFISEGTSEAIWLEENCYKYGFVIRYPRGKEAITGYNYEPWHVRYVGKEIAEKAYINNMVLEELL